MYKPDLGLNNQQCLICHKTKPYQTKSFYKPGSVTKSSVDKESDQNSKIPYADLKSKTSQILTKKLQPVCNKNTHNKLYQVQFILKERKPNYSRT